MMMISNNVTSEIVRVGFDKPSGKILISRLRGLGNSRQLVAVDSSDRRACVLDIQAEPGRDHLHVGPCEDAFDRLTICRVNRLLLGDGLLQDGRVDHMLLSPGW